MSLELHTADEAAYAETVRVDQSSVQSIAETLDDAAALQDLSVFETLADDVMDDVMSVEERAQKRQRRLKIQEAGAEEDERWKMGSEDELSRIVEQATYKIFKWKERQFLERTAHDAMGAENARELRRFINDTVVEANALVRDKHMTRAQAQDRTNNALFQGFRRRGWKVVKFKRLTLSVLRIFEWRKWTREDEEKERAAESAEVQIIDSDPHSHSHSHSH